MDTLNLTTVQNLERMFFPCVFSLVNEKTKTIWISRTGCLAEALLRTIKSIKEARHPIKDLAVFELVCLYSGENLLYNHSRICQEYKDKGYTLLNRPVKYYIKKRLKKQENDKYVTKVVLGTRNYDLKTLGEFNTMLEADGFISQWQKTNSIQKKQN